MISKGLKNIYLNIQNMWLGSQVLSINDRNEFHFETLMISCNRSLIAVSIILVIQFFNVIIDHVTNLHADYIVIIRYAEAFMTIIAIFYIVLFTLIKTNLITKPKQINIILVSCWIAILLASLPFNYCELYERQSLTNYTLVILAIGLIPIFEFKMILKYAGAYFLFNLILVMSIHLDFFIFQQTIILIILALYTSQIQFKTSLIFFQDRQKLNEINTKLIILANTDQLTSLLNRRGLDQYVYDLLVNRDIINDSNIGLFMIDIDLFKVYNDTYYHLMGDECLQRIATCIKSTLLDKTNIIARYGGEEFVAVIKNIDSDALIILANKVKKAVFDLHIEACYLKELPYVTISIGVSQAMINIPIVDKHAFSNDIINLADKQLYFAKANGRNCIALNYKIY